MVVVGLSKEGRSEPTTSVSHDWLQHRALSEEWPVGTDAEPQRHPMHQQNKFSQALEPLLRDFFHGFSHTASRSPGG